jgi:adenylate cyclase
MSFEIERKFLVRGEAWKKLVTNCTRIRQGYLTSDGKASIRVRIKCDGGSTLTVKSRGADLRRLELEYTIPTLEAEAMLALRTGAVVEKVRNLVPWNGLPWEIDVFGGDNDGLTIAEVELRDEHQRVDLPPWIGAEVTGQPQYYNSYLARQPFCSWPSLRTGAAQ